MALTCCKNVEIVRVRNLPCLKFISDYLQKGVPVVIEDATDEWLARYWTLDSLEAKAGANKVNVRANTSCYEYRIGRKYNIRQTTFSSYIKDLKEGNSRSKNSYLAVQNIKKAFPQLQDDMVVPEYVGKMHAGPFLWIAPAGHYVLGNNAADGMLKVKQPFTEYCHFDPDDGFLAIMQGYKQVRLYGCDPNPLYPNALGSKGRTVQAQVDCDDPDLETHPLFAGTTCHHTTLNPGDMLYIPAFWWHQVTTPVLSISINIFWGDGGENEYLKKVMSPPVWDAFRHWLLNIIEQNTSCSSFPRVLQRLPESLRNFFITQWHEMASEEQLEKLVSLIVKHLDIDSLPEQTHFGKHPTPLHIRGLLWRD